jgi:hypothetical protein
MVRRDGVAKTADVRFRHFWGEGKRGDLLTTLDLEPTAFDETYAAARPTAENRFTLLPDAALAAYRGWPSLSELSETDDWSGLLEKRKGALMGHDLASLRERIERYCDPSNSLAALREQKAGPVEPAARFNPETARANLFRQGGVKAGRFARIALAPFDDRWCFHTNVRL